HHRVTVSLMFYPLLYTFLEYHTQLHLLTLICSSSTPPTSHNYLLSFPTRRSSDLVCQLANRITSATWRMYSSGTSSWKRSLMLRSEEQRLNSSHQIISYAVFCLKKKKKK